MDTCIKYIQRQHSYLNDYKLKTVENVFDKVTQQPIKIGGTTYGTLSNRASKKLSGTNAG